MSNKNLAESWKTEKFRQSVIDKINCELSQFRLKLENPGRDIEKAVFEKVRCKRHYLGYVAKIVLIFRNMVCIQEDWLYNKIKEILSKPPPRLRQVLSPEDLGQYNVEMMKLRLKIQEEFNTRNKN